MVDNFEILIVFAHLYILYLKKSKDSQGPLPAELILILLIAMNQKRTEPAFSYV